MTDAAESGPPGRAWKFLDERGWGMITGFAWPPPGEWVTVDGPLEDCVRGIHACRLTDLGWWLSAQLWEIELAGDHLEGQHAVVASRGRLVRPVEGWPAVGGELAAWATWRCRDRTAELWQPVDPGVAAALRRASTIDALAGVAHQLPVATGRPEQEAAAYLAAHLAAGSNPVPACVNGAQSAAHHALATGAGPADAAFAAEREAQSRWLADRLALS